MGVVPLGGLVDSDAYDHGTIHALLGYGGCETQTLDHMAQSALVP